MNLEEKKPWIVLPCIEHKPLMGLGPTVRIVSYVVIILVTPFLGMIANVLYEVAHFTLKKTAYALNA